jgi:hypothetical protein
VTLVAESETKPTPGGWENRPVKALTLIARYHKNRHGWCNVCGGKWPCFTWRLADAGIMNKSLTEFIENEFLP